MNNLTEEIKSKLNGFEAFNEIDFSNNFAILYLNQERMITGFNKKFLEITGFSEEEIKGKKESLFFRNQQSEDKEWSDNYSGKIYSKKRYWILKNGQSCLLEEYYIPIYDSQKNTKNLAKILIKKEKEVLEEVMDKLFIKLEMDVDGNIIYVNESFLEITGFRLDEIQGKKYSEICDDQYLQSIEYKNFWSNLQKATNQNLVVELKSKKKSNIFLKSIFLNVYDDNDFRRIIQYSENVSDEIKKAKQQETDILFMKSIFDNIPVNIIVADKESKINYINKKSLETLKEIEKDLPISVDKILGQSYDIFHKSPKVQRELLKEDKNLPHKARIKVGSNFLSLLASAIYDSNHKYLGPMVTWSLITDQVKFIENVTNLSKTLFEAIKNLNENSAGLIQNAGKFKDLSNSAASATEEVSQGVRTVATNTEEMSASIKEIARHASEVSVNSGSTLQKAQTTNLKIKKLGQSSQEIGNVIKVISSIAQQTNLLALNATIEAARAGEAGRGFAVVASEVKELAKQTSKATEDITIKIKNIQKDSSNAIEAVVDIGQTIERLNDVAGSIAASVEEQSATTNEVSRIVHESASGILNIAENVKTVSKSASDNLTNTNEIKQAVEILLTASNDLVSLIQRLDAEL